MLYHMLTRIHTTTTINRYDKLPVTGDWFSNRIRTRRVLEKSTRLAQPLCIGLHIPHILQRLRMRNHWF